MTLQEFMQKPIYMDFVEYEKKIDQLHKLEKKCRSLLDKITWEAESMEVFDDHTDPLYIKHKGLHEKYHTQFTKYMDELQNLKNELKG